MGAVRLRPAPLRDLAMVRERARARFREIPRQGKAFPDETALSLTIRGNCMKTIEQLADELKRLPPMTGHAKEEQRLDWAYGNLACSTNHKPRREVFRSVALERGWTEEQFDKWAAGREWW